MAEYIEREALVKSVLGITIANPAAAQYADAVLWYIRQAPAAEVAPVVRCCDCKRWDADPDSYGKDNGPKGRCMKSFEETLYNDFCSYGERKESQDGV